MSEAAAGAPAAGGSETPNTNPEAVAAPPVATPAWAAPATREDFEKQAEEFALSRKETRTINGKQVTRSRAEWLRQNQQFEGLNAKHQQVTQAAERLVNGYKDPQQFRAIAAELGLSPREFAQKILEEEHRLESMTPEQRELAQLRSQREEWQRQQEEREEKEQEQKEEQEIERHKSELLDIFDRSFQAIGWDPPDHLVHFAVSRMASLYDYARTNGIQVSYQKLAEKVRDELNFDVKTEWSRMPREKRLELLDEEDRKALRERDLASFGRPGVQHPAQTQPRTADGKFTPTGTGEKPVIVGSFAEFQRAKAAVLGRQR